MTDLPLRSRLLLLLRSNLWRSEQQLCKAICRRNRNADISQELDLMKGEGLVQYWDTSFVRFQLTTAGRNAAARVVAARVKGKAA